MGNQQLQFAYVTGMDPEPEEGNLHETALCHYMPGGLTADNRGYLNYRKKMRTLKQNPDFDLKSSVWPDLQDENIAERNRD